MQLLIEGTLESLLSALQLARRSHNAKRAEQVQVNCCTDSELVLTHAKAYHKRFPVMMGGRGGAKARHAVWHRDHCHVRIVKEDARTVGGFMVLNGKLLGLHNQTEGRGDWMMQHACNLGARHLDCFDVPALVQLYQRWGFKEVGRLDNFNQGGPDVLSMRRN